MATSRLGFSDRWPTPMANLMTAPQPDPSDIRPRTGGHVGLLIAAALGAGLIGSIGVLALFATSSRPVDPATLRPGQIYWTVDTPAGPETFVRCPSPASWITGPRDELCASAVRSVAAVAGALLGLSALFALLAIWHWRQRRTLRNSPPAAQQYRQDGMPATYWLAATVVGLLVALMLIVVVPALFDPGPPAAARIAGPLFWLTVMWQIGRVYGLSAAYRLDLDGDTVIWRSPTRRRELAVTDLTGVTVTPAGTWLLGERRAVLTTADGRSHPVVVPNRHHQDRLRVFCSALARANPTFDWSQLRLDGPATVDATTWPPGQ